MRGWQRTGFYVGWMLLITWLFGVLGYHTPATFAISTVGSAGFGLVLGCGFHALERDPAHPPARRGERDGEVTTPSAKADGF